MTPSARIQAAIEILDQVIAAARDDGPPADAIVQRYFKTRRYAGSKDRRAVRELVFRAIRRSGERPDSGRSAMLGLADDDAELLFDGSPHGPAAREESESGSPASFLPQWIEQELSPLVAPEEWPALLERAPLDLRVNIARTGRDVMAPAFPEAMPTAISPWGLRLPADSRVDDRAEFADGLVEVQDEGSQLIALACAPDGDMTIVDLCAGAGGKALALAAAAPKATIIACDTNRARLSQLEPRAARAGANITMRLIDAGREAAMLADLVGKADMVLVDAPCSGSGTWRRNPEGRWRLTPDRLDRVTRLQERLLDLAVPLVRPGRRIGLRGLFAAGARRRRAGAELLRAPFILDHAGCHIRRWSSRRAGTSPDPRARFDRRVFRRAVRGSVLGPRDWLENMMRFSPLVLMLGLATSTIAVSVHGQRPDDQLAPQSVELLKKGQAALAAGNLIAADDALETALIVDPRNRAAFVTMARVAIKQRLFGQAIRLTNKALALEPNDRDAIAVQGEAMVELGAVPRAKQNLAKLQKLCAAGCPQLTVLGATIARGPAMAAVNTPATKKVN